MIAGWLQLILAQLYLILSQLHLQLQLILARKCLDCWLKRLALQVATAIEHYAEQEAFITDTATEHLATQTFLQEVTLDQNQIELQATLLPIAEETTTIAVSHSSPVRYEFPLAHQPLIGV
ncbi:MAG: hypothetical protein F6K32_26420, partial [Desertifilum sp. SIO1I2]|nr:hypothetical protein [Desertifilum sp. SIO1I2]